MQKLLLGHPPQKNSGDFDYSIDDDGVVEKKKAMKTMTAVKKRKSMAMEIEIKRVKGGGKYPTVNNMFHHSVHDKKRENKMMKKLGIKLSQQPSILMNQRQQRDLNILPHHFIKLLFRKLIMKLRRGI